MRVTGDRKQLRPIWLDQHKDIVKVIDQRKLPHELVIMDLNSVDDVIAAIKDMVVRGAPLIGVTGAYGVFIAVRNNRDKAMDDEYLNNSTFYL